MPRSQRKGSGVLCRDSAGSNPARGTKLIRHATFMIDDYIDSLSDAILTTGASLSPLDRFLFKRAMKAGFRPVKSLVVHPLTDEELSEFSHVFVFEGHEEHVVFGVKELPIPYKAYRNDEEWLAYTFNAPVELTRLNGDVIGDIEDSIPDTVALNVKSGAINLVTPDFRNTWRVQETQEAEAKRSARLEEIRKVEREQLRIEQEKKEADEQLRLEQRRIAQREKEIEERRKKLEKKEAKKKLLKPFQKEVIDSTRVKDEEARLLLNKVNSMITGDWDTVTPTTLFKQMASKSLTMLRNKIDGHDILFRALLVIMHHYKVLPERNLHAWAETMNATYQIPVYLYLIDSRLDERWTEIYQTLNDLEKLNRLANG